MCLKYSNVVKEQEMQVLQDQFGNKNVFHFLSAQEQDTGNRIQEQEQCT
jgi:hypothetical protein